MSLFASQLPESSVFMSFATGRLMAKQRRGASGRPVKVNATHPVVPLAGSEVNNDNGFCLINTRSQFVYLRICMSCRHLAKASLLRLQVRNRFKFLLLQGLSFAVSSLVNAAQLLQKHRMKYKVLPFIAPGTEAANEFFTKGRNAEKCGYQCIVSILL